MTTVTTASARLSSRACRRCRGSDRPISGRRRTEESAVAIRICVALLEPGWNEVDFEFGLGLGFGFELLGHHPVEPSAALEIAIRVEEPHDPRVVVDADLIVRERRAQEAASILTLNLIGLCALLIGTIGKHVRDLGMLAAASG